MRLVPLLVCNQCMILAGVTSQVYEDKLLKWLIYGISLVFGGCVFLMSSSCLRALYNLVTSNRVPLEQRKRGRRVATMLAVSFIAGWFLFPLAFTFGRPGLGLLYEEVEESMLMLGDFLAKNCFVVLAAITKRHYLAPILAKSQAALPEGHHNKGRRPSTIAICPAAFHDPPSRLSYSSVLTSESREMHQRSNGDRGVAGAPQASHGLHGATQRRPAPPPRSRVAPSRPEELANPPPLAAAAESTDFPADPPADAAPLYDSSVLKPDFETKPHVETIPHVHVALPQELGGGKELGDGKGADTVDVEANSSGLGLGHIIGHIFGQNNNNNSGGFLGAEAGTKPDWSVRPQGQPPPPLLLALPELGSCASLAPP